VVPEDREIDRVMYKEPPTVVSNVVFTVSHRAVYAHHARTGEPLWTYAIEGHLPYGPISSDGESIYILFADADSQGNTEGMLVAFSLY